ncbi:MAG TPA: molybdopterin-dependent oxidoreductase [Dehalococcoidia bacterium]|nr:molybdopterin-dependent oxidoreductase [Dehalococcoidia bacterium]
MAKLTIDGREIEAPDGAPLVEVIKNAGVFISNLCYVDGLPPYAGCRTCLVEIEGARGLQLSCTSKAAEGMVVRTTTPEVKSTRQAVLSLILSYHSDRCLTCHRVVKCKPGDTCLRDDTVTHRCLTCSKNYRCELQTTCEMLEMAGYEPWDGEERTYYLLQQPEPDHGNPFLEFDPQMCIICTRCVRACDEIRHTGAITLAGRGYSTRIAFGAGGAVHDSNCDFCGACIDVCPTATLMEHPNKWAATQTERWVPTTCTQCSVGCSMSLGVKRGRGVIVRPDTTANPVSRDQLCVRGRFHYDAVKPAERLSQPLIRRNGGQEATTWDEALEYAAARLAHVREEHGPQAIGFLGSPLATNEENYLLGKIARAVVGTNNVDSSAGAVARAADLSLRRAFGSEALPADLLRLAQAKTLLVVADDLESSHNVAALRAKDAVVRNGARLIVVAGRYGELCDFAEVWVRPRPGGEAAVTAALAAAVQRAKGAPAEEPAIGEEIRQAVEKAATVITEGAEALSVVYALPHFGGAEAEAITAALCNVAVACCGDEAPGALFLLPQEANGWGLRDTGGSPELLPGYRAVDDEAARREMERLWGAPLSAMPGLTFEEMMADGKVTALVVLTDNPLMLSPEREAVRGWLEGLELLAVIDTLPTDTARLAHVVLPDTGPYGKEGTVTSADRRVLRLHAATAAQGEAQPAWRILGELGSRLAQRFQTGEVRVNYAGPGEIMDEMAQVISLYREATYREMESGAQQPLDADARGGLGPKGASLQAVEAPAGPEGDGFVLTTGRSLYTSYEGAAIHSPEADRLHREECVGVNPADAAALGIADGDEVTLRNGRASLTMRVRLTEAVQPRSLYVPLYHDGGAVSTLFGSQGSTARVEVVPSRRL